MRGLGIDMRGLNETLETLLAQARSRLDVFKGRIELSIVLEQPYREGEFKIKHKCTIGGHYDDNKVEYVSESIERSVTRAVDMFIDKQPDAPTERRLMLPANATEISDED